MQILPAGLLALTLLASSLPAPAQKVRNGLVTYPGGFVLEVGEPGSLPAPVATAGAAGELLVLNGHEAAPAAPFAGGGARQELLALGAGRGGFTAVWSDSRDGGSALFVSFLDAAGSTPLPGAPLHSPRTERALLPAVAMLAGAPGGRALGALTWTAQEAKGSRAMLRLFEQPKSPVDASSERAAASYLLELPVPLAALEGPSQVAVDLTPEGGLVLWAGHGKIGGLQLRLDPDSGRYAPAGKLTLATDAHPAGGRLELALGPGGQALAAWAESGDKGLVLRVAGTAPGNPPGPPVELGPGRPLGLAADATGGFWLLMVRTQGVELAHLEPNGKPSAGQAPVLISGAEAASAELATWGGGMGTAVLVEERRPAEGLDEGPDERRSRAGAVMLHVFGPGAARLTPDEGLDVLDAEARDARGPHLIALDASFLVAWTDSRRDQADVFWRLLELANFNRPARRWNQDEDSADQLHASVASAGKRALVAYEDNRRGAPEIFCRALELAPDNALKLGREGPINSQPDEPQAFPAVALGDRGRGLVVYKQALEGSWIPRGQLLDESGAALGATFDLDRSSTSPGAFAPACLALPSGAGFMVAWVRKGSGQAELDNPVVMRLDREGHAMSAPKMLTARGAEDARNLQLTLGQDGQVLVVWDERGRAPATPPKKPKGKEKGTSKEAQKPAKPKPPAKQRVLAGRFVTPAGSPTGGPLNFPPSPGGGDLTPVVSPLLGGGYLLAWTGNQGPSSDVFGRLLDARGQPSGPPLALSTHSGRQAHPSALALEDGRLLVAWEDDLSGRTHCILRLLEGVRGGAGQRAVLGPQLFLDTTESVAVEDRKAPELVRLGSGVLAIWDDLGRGMGHDVAGRWVHLD